MSDSSNRPNQAAENHQNIRALIQTDMLAEFSVTKMSVLTEIVRLCYHETVTVVAQKAARLLETLPDISLLFYALDGKREYLNLLSDLLNRKEFMSRYRTNGHNPIRKDLDLLRFDLPVTRKKDEKLYEAGLLILVALHTNRVELLVNSYSGIGIIEPLLELYQEGVFTDRIVNFLKDLPDHPYKDRLCWYVLENPATPIRTLVLNQEIAPLEKRERALFYFLTEQWDKYNVLDFNGALLRELYNYGLLSHEIKRQVLYAARKAGRTDLVQFLVGDEKMLGSRTVEEWQFLAQTNVSEKNWANLWLLAQTAPPIVALRILRTLVKANWQPTHLADQEVFNRLVKKAEDCAATGGLPFGWPLELKSSRRFTLPSSEPFHKVLLGPDGRTLVLSFIYRIEVWDIKEDIMLASIPARVDQLNPTPDSVLLLSNTEVPYMISQLALSPDCKKLAVADCWLASWWGYNPNEHVSNVRIRVYNISKNSEMPFLSYEEELTAPANLSRVELTFSRDNQQLAASFCGKAYVWQLGERNYPQRSFNLVASQSVIQFTPDSRYIIGATNSPNPQLWRLDLINGDMVELAEGCLRLINNMVFTPDGNYLLLTNTRNALQLWRYPEMTNLATKVGHDFPADSVLFLPNSNRLITRHFNLIKMWEIPSLNLLSSQLYPNDVRDLQVSFDREEQALLVFLFPNYFSTVNNNPQQMPDFFNEFLHLDTSSQDNCFYWTGAITKLATTPVPLNPLSHLHKVSEHLNSPDLPPPEKTWLDFIQTLLSYRARFAIEIDIGHTVYAEAHDIELEEHEETAS